MGRKESNQTNKQRLPCMVFLSSVSLRFFLFVIGTAQILSSCYWYRSDSFCHQYPSESFFLSSVLLRFFLPVIGIAQILSVISITQNLSFCHRYHSDSFLLSSVSLRLFLSSVSLRFFHHLKYLFIMFVLMLLISILVHDFIVSILCFSDCSCSFHCDISLVVV